MKRKLWKAWLAAAVSAMLLMGCSNTAEPSDGNTVADTAVEENVSTEAEPVESESVETEPVCVHEWKEATYAEPKTCTVCGETEGEKKQTYFEEHGAQVKDAPVDCTVDGIIYDGDFPEQQKVTDVKWQQLDCYSEPAEEDGYLLVHLELHASLQLYHDSDKNIDYNRCQLMDGCFDWYTGRFFPTRGTIDDDTVEYTVMINVDGVSYDVSYTKEVKGEFGGWIADASGDCYNDVSAYVTYIFKIPEGYDGIVFAAVPETEFIPEEYDFKNIDESEKYAFDEEEHKEGTVFFRINKERMAPLRQAAEESSSQ